MVQDSKLITSVLTSMKSAPRIRPSIFLCQCPRTVEKSREHKELVKVLGEKALGAGPGRESASPEEGRRMWRCEEPSAAQRVKTGESITASWWVATTPVLSAIRCFSSPPTPTGAGGGWRRPEAGGNACLCWGGALPRLQTAHAKAS